MTFKVWHIIKKNLRLLIRSKTSGLVVILGPLLIVALLGMAFSKSATYSLNVGVYSEQFNNLSNSLIDQMKDKQFSITKYRTDDTCVDDLKRDRIQVCVGFPKDFEIRQGGSNNVTFHVDYSRINLAYMILDMIEGKVSSSEAGIRQNLTADLLARIVAIEGKTKDNRALLDKLRSDGEKQKKLIADAQANINNMQLEFNLKDLSVSEMAGRSKLVADYSADVNGFVKTRLSQIEVKAKSTNASDVAALAVNTSKELEPKFDILRNETALLQTLISTANSKLGSLDTNLATARSAKTAAISAITLAGETLKSMDSTMGELDQNMAAISATIAGIQIRDPTLIAEPITTTIKPIAKEKTHLNTLLPSLMVLIVMITGILLSSTLMVADKLSRANFRNYLTPTSSFTFNLATYLTSVFIITLQLGLFLVVSTYFFNVSVMSNFLVTALILFTATSLFIMIGMFIGHIFRTEETNTLASITLASGFMFFSNLILPIESMPVAVQQMAHYNPFVIAEQLLKQSLFFSYDFSQIGLGLLVLGEYFVVLFIALLGLQYAIRRRVFTWHMNKK